MLAPTGAINLQFGKSALPYQDLILRLCFLREFRSQKRVAAFAESALIQSIPNKCGNHSEISGM
jgi:hypothetical protein